MNTYINGLILVVLIFSTTHADTLEVPKDHPTIQSAIDASVTGDVVMVSPGNYLEAIDFIGKNITVQSVAGPMTTGIKPPIGASTPTVTFASKEAGSAILSGFSIGGGIGGPIIDPVFGPCFGGGGIFCYESSPQVLNCILTGNSGGGSSSVLGHGGGMLVMRGNPTIHGCEFRQNSATGHGGAIYLIDHAKPTIELCVFENHSASWGGAITCTISSSASFIDCQFIANEAFNVGGGIYIRSSSSPTFDQCLFLENIQAGNTTAGGAAVTMYGSGNGGGPCNPQFNSCEFIGNQAQGYGGAVHAAYSGNATMIDCQFSLNSSEAGGGAIAALGHAEAPTLVDIRDSIIDANQTNGNGGGIDSRMATLVIKNVDITANQAGMSGGGCSFQSSDDSTIENSTLCGNVPEQYSGVFQDIGGNTITDECSACAADFNGDGIVNGADFGILLVMWGPCSECLQDLNGDGMVNGADVGLFLSMWGTCP